MKILFLGLMFILAGCGKESESARPDTIVATANATKDTEPVSQDTIPAIENVDMILDKEYFSGYPKDVLDNYQQWFSEVNDSYVVSPEIAFVKLQQIPTGKYDVLKGRFTSEVGEDSFYALYSHFLKIRNGPKRFIKERENVLNLFRHINRINSRLQYGGTFFGHQQYRLYGHAEYALYQFGDNDWLVKKYSINKQKKLFLDSIRQRILDEEEYDYYTLGDAKLARRKELFQLVDKMDKLITNFFYLKVAQEFQYSNYL